MSWYCLGLVLHADFDEHEWDWAETGQFEGVRIRVGVTKFPNASFGAARSGQEIEETIDLYGLCSFLNVSVLRRVNRVEMDLAVSRLAAETGFEDFLRTSAGVSPDV